MRSHLITISSPSDHHKNDEKSPKKKLPPLSNPKTDLPMDQLAYGLRENPKKTSKFTKPDQHTALLQDKCCKECGKAFQSWKALFGHMKCHSVNGNSRVITNCLEEDSWNSCSDHQKPIMDSHSDNEVATPSSSLCRKKRSDRMMKRYTPTTTSSSLTIANSVCEMDQHEQEEVALSLIILSRDKGEWGGLSSFVESSDNSPELSEANRIKKKLKKLKSMKQLEVNDEVEVEFEVNSPKNLIKRGGDQKKSSSRKRKAANSSHDSICHELEKSSKFTCSICKKAFQSYQALGGHRASHKKFKGCCAPRSEENSLETENSENQSENLVHASAECKKSKDHECPICFKVFPSGQALGGHKRSHLIMDQAKNNAPPPPPAETEKPAREIRGFLDLNLPAPAEEECNEFKPWWLGAGPLLGLLSS